MPLFSKRARLMPGLPPADARCRSLRLELLEPRQLLSSTPWGAGSLDTAEYLLGDVGVTLVLMESQGSVSSEDWDDRIDRGDQDESGSRVAVVEGYAGDPILGSFT